jgi:hypothetical protein
MLKSFQQLFISKCLLLLTALFLQGCSNNPLLVDVSNVKINEVKFLRFEQDLFAINKGDFEKNKVAMLNKYGDFFTGFVAQLIHPEGINDSLFEQKITEFVTDINMNELYNVSKLQYAEMSTYENKLTDAMKYYKYYFPNAAVPRFVTMVSGLNYNVAPADSTIGVSIEMYLGSKNKFYDMAEIPIYLRQKMNSYNLISDLIKGMAMDKFPNNNAQSTLLTEMVYNGKILYFIDAITPQENDTCKIAYTAKEWTWAERHEADVWGFMLKNKLLFTTSNNDIAKYINDAPFTSGMVKESPGRIGCWIGWRIVKKYMQLHPEIKLEQLMNDADAQKILNQSNYKP